jgi:hypothetical protein
MGLKSKCEIPTLIHHIRNFAHDDAEEILCPPVMFMPAVGPPSFTFKWVKLSGHEFDHSSPSVSRFRMSEIIPLFLLRSFGEWKGPILTCKL